MIQRFITLQLLPLVKEKKRPIFVIFTSGVLSGLNSNMKANKKKMKAIKNNSSGKRADGSSGRITNIS